MRPTTLRLSSLSLSLLAIGAFPTAQAQTSDEDSGGPHQLAPVEVQSSADASAEGLSKAYAGGQVAEGGSVGILGSQSVMETPYSFTSYTEQLIEDQQAASVGEILLNDPAVRVARGFGNYQQVYLVRGLPVYSDDMTYNGLYGLLPRQYLASEFIERVQVFRGANTFLKGAAPGGSGLGGGVNVLPKRAPNEPINQITLGARSGGQGMVAADVANRSDDGRFGIRVNAARRDGDTAVDGEESELSMAHIGLDYRGDALRVSADLGFQKHRIDGGQPNITFKNQPDQGIVVPITDAPNADESIGQSWTYSDSNDLFGTLRAEYDFSDNITAWAALGARQGEEDSIFANPTVDSSNGNYTANRFDTAREDTVVTGETGVRFTFDTGAIGHSLTVSGSTYELRSKNAYAMALTATTGNIYRPEDKSMPIADFPGGNLDSPQLTAKTRFNSVALADQLSMLDERLLVTLGARYQNIQDKSYAYGGGPRNASYDDHALSPSVGVLYKLTPAVSVYASYIEGLQRGQVASAENNNTPVVNAGEALEPYETEQSEVGVKYDGGRLGGSVSVYRSRKPVAGYTAANVYKVVDHQENTGVELMAYGNLTRDLSVLGGLSFLDADVDGNDAIGSPETQANLNLEYRVPQLPDLAVDGRVIYTSSQYADEANTQKVDAWTRLDLGARYLIALSDSMFLTLRGRVENVTGEDYWASAGGFPGAGYLTVGAPRTVLLSATLDY
ncbi:TonB-dependent siderophore receptor subfamily [Alloalcanivorax dieselolei B5]|uniref:TonB-dependent siderophore receptor subfamily n=1 Tax=Alcanivorax dieselolei (strain DSM 16502 / CGMCC 1.3690 / MCCC 1A00001 / B-5) TaxID=930169 RepID=K0CCQ7_ALCDB|nr:TonB-dependent receptor [Alloalcanivorax dieselolei]AFT69326.1 TonB-dependent siderophore receptor subfamily [Alloalcanivorax dieselolei B5]GGJ91744.1 TonB-dependent receptor [Alloalcanivorax dieselolei]